MPTTVVKSRTGHPSCPWCARSYWHWLKDRMTNMARRVGGAQSFAEAAATSIKPDPEE
ncbi:MAG TPA: hypothetical protein VEA41_16380 [Salinarimonas sp.]|nr:hypothetical protein [Salinarimonas sp.]